MNIKNFLKITCLAIFMAFAVPAQTFATVTTTTTAPDPDKTAERLAAITARVNEIQSMDKTELTASDKRALRKELKGMNKELSGLDQRVYLSVGAIIIIILLLILIL